MKKIAFLLALLMVVGMTPAWCLVATVDNYIDTHTKDSGFRPVQDTGELYGTVNHGIGTALDKVPVVQHRSVIISPLDKLMGDTINAGKLIINGTWDLLTLKSMRDKREKK